MLLNYLLESVIHKFVVFLSAQQADNWRTFAMQVTT